MLLDTYSNTGESAATGVGSTCQNRLDFRDLDVSSTACTSLGQMDALHNWRRLHGTRRISPRSATAGCQPSHDRTLLNVAGSAQRPEPLEIPAKPPAVARDAPVPHHGRSQSARRGTQPAKVVPQGPLLPYQRQRCHLLKSASEDAATTSDVGQRHVKSSFVPIVTPLRSAPRHSLDFDRRLRLT